MRKLAEGRQVDAAAEALPEGDARAAVGERLAPCWATISRACAIAVTCSEAPAWTPLTPEEKRDAAAAAVALAALAAAHDDPRGFFAVAKLAEHLERLAQETDLPRPLRRAARLVATGRLQAGSRDDERELLNLLIPEEPPAVVVDSSKTDAPAEAPPLDGPPRAVWVDERTRRFGVGDRPLPGVARLSELERAVMAALFKAPGGIHSSKALARATGWSEPGSRKAYAKLAKVLVVSGTPVLATAVPGFYALAPGFVGGVPPG